MRVYRDVCIARVVLAAGFVQPMRRQRPCGLLDKAVGVGARDCGPEPCQGHREKNRRATNRRRMKRSGGGRAEGRGRRREEEEEQKEEEEEEEGQVAQRSCVPLGSRVAKYAKKHCWEGCS